MRERPALDLVMLDDWEALALRGVLERFGFTVNLMPIGRPQHLVDVLSSAASSAPHMLLCYHGDERGILPEGLAPEVAREEPFNDVLTPERLAAFANLPGRVVVGTGCSTGSDAFAHAFLQGSCDAYIAPVGYPEGNAVLLFIVHFYYELAEKRPWREAVERARCHDDETGLFQLFDQTMLAQLSDYPTDDR